MSATAITPDMPLPRVAHGGGVASVFRAESRKLQSQLSNRLLALVCLLGPFAFTAVLSSQSASPADTLFGFWVHSSGFAIPLVVLGFAGSWGFPLVVGVVAGDIFSSEDRYSTWKAVLTRSRSRWEVFAGKVLAGAAFSLGMLMLVTVSSIVAGLIFVGDQSLIGLSGTLISPGKALLLVLISWITSVLPMLAFTSLAILLSIVSRNGIVGVIGPSIAGLVMQLLILIGAGVGVHTLLIGNAFNDWHPLFLSHPFYSSLILGCVVSIVWIVACLAASWLILRRRDFAGTPVTRRAGWVMPTRLVVAFAVLIGVLAVGCNWGPAGVTPARVRNSLTPTFTSLTLLQQRELGRYVAHDAKLNIQTTCSRRASTPDGPGDWVCTLVVYVPEPSAIPFQATPVAYDVSINSDGCYKATSPPSFIGNQTMTGPHKRSITNPLFTFYGCFNTL